MENERLIDKHLDRLTKLIAEMGSAVVGAVNQGMQAVVERDSILAAKVLARDDDIDRLELEIDRAVTEIFVLLQPAARDLRFVIAVARMAPILERIADHAGNIASEAIELNNEPQLKEYVDLPRMGSRASEMLDQAIDAFIKGDSASARQIIAMDKEVDSIYHKVVRELMETSRSESAGSTRTLHLLFVAKHIERIGDYVKDVCELTVYMIEAESIKHSAASVVNVQKEPD